MNRPVSALRPKEQRFLGRTGISVPRIGLGCATFGREIDADASFAIMDHAVEHGITLFDTAEAYGGGQAREYRRTTLGVDDQREVSGEMHSSEKIIGRWLRSRGCRQEIVLVSKVTANFTTAHLREALDASLERLQTDFVDVYLFHQFDPKTPAEDGLAALNEVAGSGKARAIGCSNYSAEQLRNAFEVSRRLGLRRFEVTEPPYSLAARDIEKDLLPMCQQEEVGVLAYSPLAAGFLTGKYAPDRSAFPKGSRFDVIPGHADVYFSERNFRVVSRLGEMAERVATPAVRLAIGFVMRNPAVTTVLIGARTTAHLENALRAQDMEFPAEWLDEINRWN